MSAYPVKNCDPGLSEVNGESVGRGIVNGVDENGNTGFFRVEVARMRTGRAADGLTDVGICSPRTSWDG